MPVYLLQQAERRTEYQKDIEKVSVGQRNLELTRYGLSAADFLRRIFERKAKFQ